MSTYPHSGNEYIDKQDHVDIYKAKDINDVQNEIAYVENVLTGGANGQVLTADVEGKANWEDASGGGGFQSITVNSDWTTAQNAWNDIKASTGMEFFNTGGNNSQLLIYLWASGDNWARLKGTSDTSWVYDSYYGFNSPPSSGTAYIIGITFTSSFDPM